MGPFYALKTPRGGSLLRAHFQRRLAGRIALLGLRVGALEPALAEARAAGDLRYRVEALERRQGRAKRAYASALKDLATLRRLLGPKLKARP